MTLHLLSCDESGHSGPNYLDLSQPIYVHAGWLLPEGSRGRIAKAMKSFDHERKGADLLRTSRGSKLTCVSLRRVFNAGAVPFVVAFEKRYAIACQMIETYLDPEYNNRLTNRWMWTGEASFKQRIADRLLELSNEAHVAFAKSFRELDSGGLKEALERIQLELQSRAEKDQMLGTLMKGASSQLDRQVGEMKDSYDRVGKGANTINFLNFATLLHLVSGYAAGRRIETVAIEHDENKHLSQSFSWAVKMLDELFSVHFEYGEYNSSAHPGIQAADLLANCWRVFIQNACIGSANDSSLLDLIKLLFPLLPDTNKKPDRWWFVGSESSQRQLARSLSAL